MYWYALQVVSDLHWGCIPKNDIYQNNVNLTFFTDFFFFCYNWQIHFLGQNFWTHQHNLKKGKNGKAIPVTGCGGPQGYMTLRLPYFLDNRLTVVSEVVSLTCWLPFTSTKSPGTHLCSSLSRTQGYGETAKIRSIEKSNDLLRNQTCDLPACSIMPESATLLYAPRTQLKPNLIIYWKQRLNNSIFETQSNRIHTHSILTPIIC
jgi:hypothetical protein